MTKQTNPKATKDELYELVKEIRQERYDAEAAETGSEPKKVGTKKDIKAEIEDVFEAIKELLLDNVDVPLTNIGILKVKERAARKGRNPQDGTEMEIKGRRAVGFTESKFLKDTFKSE